MRENIQDIEQIMRGFLWSQGTLKKGKAKVAWDIVCLPKDEGGLGVRKLEHFNVALIAAHIWRLLSLKQSLWVQWIHTYKLRGKSFWEVESTGNLSWSWRKLLHVRLVVRKHFWHQIGNGCTTSAWFDMWSKNSPLIEKLSPRLISNDGFRLNAKVSDVVANDSWTWPDSWSLRFDPGVPPIIHPERHDVVKWKDHLGNVVEFSVLTAWENVRTRSVKVSWFHMVWFKQCIPKHSFILWLAVLRKLKTQDVLRSWDVGASTNQDDFLCPLCASTPDSHHHLFFECAFSEKVWHTVRVKAHFMVNSVCWDDIVSEILSFAHKNSIKSVVTKLLFAASIYNIWRERNSRFFGRKKRSPDQLAASIIHTVRLKLFTFRFKKSRRLEELRIAWDLPSYITHVR